MDSETHWLFWLCWALMVAVLVWQIAYAWTKPAVALGFPTVAAILWMYFYVVLPFYLVKQYPGAVAPRIFATAQLQAFLAFASLLLGWNYGLGRRKVQLGAAQSLDLGQLWIWSIGLQVVGLAGYYSFAASGRSIETTSAYWYLAFNLCYPGMSLGVVVLTLSPRHRHIPNFLVFAALASLIILPHLFTARRGPTFVAIIALSFSYLLARARLPKPIEVFGILIGSGFLLVCLVTAREVLYQEWGTWDKVFAEMAFKDVIEARFKSTSDNEFYNGCLLLEANQRTGLYQYGTTHLAMLVHWIPRSLWAGKPPRNQGFFPTALDDLHPAEISNLGGGGAWGAVADTFDNYWWFFPVFWFLFGWGVAAVFSRAMIGHDLNWRIHYVGVLCAVHWFIAQCLPEALVPALFYQAAYFLAFRSARLLPRRQPRRTRRQRPLPAPAAA